MAFEDIERPSWQRTPCPSWCVGVHAESDGEDDRRHQSEGATVPLVMLDLDTRGQRLTHTAEATEFVIHATGRLDDADTWVYVGEAEGGRQHIRVSLESARRLVPALQRHLDVL